MVDEHTADEVVPRQVLTSPEMHLRVEYLESRLAELISTVGQLKDRLALSPPAPPKIPPFVHGASG